MESIAIKLAGGSRYINIITVGGPSSEGIRYRASSMQTFAQTDLRWKFYNRYSRRNGSETNGIKMRAQKYSFPLIVRIIRVSRVQLLFNLRTSITRYRVTALCVSQPIAAQWIFIGRNSTARGKFIAQRDILLRRCIITRISLHRGNDTLGFTLYIRSNPV